MQGMKSVARISCGLTGLLASLVLLAAALGFFPDERHAALMVRKEMCQSLGVTFSTLASHVGKHRVKKTFEEIRVRSQDILSIGVRSESGELVMDVGNHSQHWHQRGRATMYSHLSVPIYNAEGVYGWLEMRFLADEIPKLSTELQLAGFLAVTSFAVSLFYLQYVLQRLNPSRAIPQRVQEALNTLAEGLMIVDQQERIVLLNDALQRIVNRIPDELIGRPAAEIALIPRNDDEHTKEKSLWSETLRDGCEVRGRLMDYVLSDGRTLTFSVSCSPILDENGNSRGAIASFEDVSHLEKQKLELKSMVEQLNLSSEEIRRQNQELEILATRDPLTGCLNRRSFFEQFEQRWREATEVDGSMAAMMVDVDHFKSINDSHGHAVGDEVLQLVGLTLRNAARGDDLVCRYGGEEFTIVMPGASLEIAERRAEEIRGQLAAVKHPLLSITASLGVSARTEDTFSSKELLEQADQCLYLAKRNGRNKVVSIRALHEEFPPFAECEAEGKLAMQQILELCDDD